MSNEPIGIEQREHEHAMAVEQLEAVAALWLDQRAMFGASMSAKCDAILSDAIQAVRRTDRRLEETRKRVAR